MTDLIDREALLKSSFRIEGSFNLGDGRKQVFVAVPIQFIENAPTVDAVPVVHGRWENIESARGLLLLLLYATCPECGDRCARDSYGGIIAEKYCKNCGAKMDLKDGENNGSTD